MTTPADQTEPEAATAPDPSTATAGEQTPATDVGVSRPAGDGKAVDELAAEVAEQTDSASPTSAQAQRDVQPSD